MNIPQIDNYLFNKKVRVEFNTGNELITIDTAVVRHALRLTNEKIKLISEVVEDLFEILGMRNLSAFMGELFIGSMVKASNGLLLKNPHQDGYPDLLIMSEAGKKLWASLSNNLRDKSPFSPFLTGGIEVKATCGSVPTPAQSAKKGLLKPGMRDSRIEVIKGYDWKAHHRLTNNLIGLVWDFVDNIPVIVGIFYSSELTTNDWGEIIQPKTDGGRTTSVSIMTREGVLKMYNGWIAVINDERYISFFNKFNRATIIEFLSKDKR